MTRTSSSNHDTAHPSSEELAPSNISSASTDIPHKDLQDPVVIVGLACRLPGGVTSASKLWDILYTGKSTQTQIVPDSRFNGISHLQGISGTGGYFLAEDVHNVENSFFGISNMEAAYMDPQQRKLLEVVYECFENSGASLDSVAGADIGCYVGNFTIDWNIRQCRDPEGMGRYSATGMGTSILANRISHVFDLRGPSVVMDTACSSSLYCLNAACSALESGQCSGAIVAGANLITSPEQYLGTAKAGVISRTSTCHTFDKSADGYGRAEAINALYLKKLSNAIRDGDSIRAVVLSTAVNGNGKTPGISHPDSTGQEAVIRKAYRNASIYGVHPDSVDYVECHGTGTAVGDPIEVNALARVFSNIKDTESPLLIGSVKTNFGHSEAASGLTSILKAIQAFENSAIPPTIGIQMLNPKIDFDSHIKVVQTLTKWPNPSVKRVGINSFGYGGANSHAILEAADTFLQSFQPLSQHQNITNETRQYIIPVSATKPESLEAWVKEVDVKGLGISDLVYTLGQRRSHLNGARGVIRTCQQNLVDDWKVENFGISEKQLKGSSSLAFVFTGQGAQWAQMGKKLIENFPSFQKTIEELDHVLQTLPRTQAPSWKLQDILSESGDKINEPDRAQTACTAFQIALVKLLQEWGVSPAAVVGHSSGEIAAAYTSGFLTASDAIITAYCRGIAVSDTLQTGAMIALGLGVDKAQEIIDRAGASETAVVACVNSPSSVTVSGDYDAINNIEAYINRHEDAFCRRLKTNGRAYHSHQMKYVGEAYQKMLKKYISTKDHKIYHMKSISMISTVTAEPIIRLGSLEPEYWRRNLESPVLFQQAVEELERNSEYHVIEIGPHSALQLPLKQIRLPGRSYLSAIQRSKDPVNCVFGLVSDLFKYGYDVKFSAINQEGGGLRCMSPNAPRLLTNLPPYKWYYEEPLCAESRVSIEYRHQKHCRHELLGSKIPGGDGINHRWRNFLRINDVSWLKDHKLNSKVVLPATGYIGIATAALTQILDSTSAKYVSFTFRNVHIASPVVLPEDDTHGIELFTTLHAAKISSTDVSARWYEFEIMTFQAGQGTTHCTGYICLEQSKYPAQNITTDNNFEVSKPTHAWYNKLDSTGLNFGPQFQSIREFHTPNPSTNRRQATSIVKPVTTITPYAVHPILLDACLQTGIIARAGGILGDVKGIIPVFIESLRTKSLDLGLLDATNLRSKAIAAPEGFSTTKISATLSAGSIQIAQFYNVKFKEYRGSSAMLDKANEESSASRHPCFRIKWKPDISLLLSSQENISYKQLQQVIQKYNRQGISSRAFRSFLAVLELMVHKNPRMSILQLGGRIRQTDTIWASLGTSSSFELYRSYTIGEISHDGKVRVQGASNEVGRDTLSNDKTFDTIVLPDEVMAGEDIANHLKTLEGHLNPGGYILAATSAHSFNIFQEHAGFSVLAYPNPEFYDIVVAIKATPSASNEVLLPREDVLLVHNSTTEIPLLIATYHALLPSQHATKIISLANLSTIEIPPRSLIISFLESEKPLLANMATPELVSDVQLLIARARTLLWVTVDGIHAEANPEMALVRGLARAVHLENPALAFATFDVSSLYDCHVTSAKNLIEVLLSFEKEAFPGPQDFEYAQDEVGCVHVSRFVPDDGLSIDFRRKLEGGKTMTTLAEMPVARLDIETPGIFDELFFRPADQSVGFRANEEDFVEVEVKTVALNAKDVYILAGKVDARDSTCSHECTGIVRGVGSNVQGIKSGDRVVVVAPGHFQTVERFPEWACVKLKPEEPLEIMATIPCVYMTALYALFHRANIQKHQSLLIHSAAGGVGLAAIQIARLRGAEVFATIGSPSKIDFLRSKTGLPNSHIFVRDSTLIDRLLAVTGGAGFDVVLNSLTGDALHDSWRCVAEFGHFIEIGKRDIVRVGRLDMDIFGRGASFSAFDLDELYYSPQSRINHVYAELLRESFELYRAGKITAIQPLQVFGVEALPEALRFFSSRNRVGKVVVDLRNPSSPVKLLPPLHTSQFSAEKTYVMIGCLGGLGRSLTRWMLAHGARQFVFLARSGASKHDARQLLDDIEAMSGVSTVVTGDVSVAQDVEAAYSACQTPVGGVVQAAMGLGEALFNEMTADAWQTGMRPKVTGTWNLHNALASREEQLDFFLLLSSVSGSVGTATESNYCAANSFLDAFARYRRALGKPATSVGLGMISEVGYLHENSEIEALLLRKGIQPLNEEEFLHVVDLALSEKIPAGQDLIAAAHILTGLEPLALRNLRAKGFDVTNQAFDDARAGILANALDKSATEAANPNASTAADSPIDPLSAIRKRFSALVLLPVEKIDNAKPLAHYGMDSMVAAEFRSWFWQTFTLDVPFLELLSRTVTLKGLEERVVTGRAKKDGK